MYEKKNRNAQKQIQFVTLDDLVPKDHILRAIDDAIDFSFIYDEVEGMYSSSQKGNLGIDPVSLFKIVFIQYLFGIRSMRQTIKEINVNVAYRWFIGYDLMEPIPHFTTFGKNYTRRFKGTDIFKRIFYRILDEADKNGFIDASAIFIDGTHIKANANRNKKERIKIDQPVKNYQQELEKEINEDRKIHGKKPINTKTPPKEKIICKSKTDPESGLFVKGEHERCFAYVANTACDKHNFILDFVVGAGNIHDSKMFHDVYKKLDRYNTVNEAVAVDAGYKTPAIMREITLNGKIPCVPYKRPMTKDGFFRKYEYVYDEYYDCMICPNNQVLNYSTTNRDGYREYKSNTNICKNCPYLNKCTNSKNCVKVVTSHIWSKYMDLAEGYRYVPRYRDIYKLRSQTIERVFADAKEKHAMRYTRMSGLEKVKLQVTLTFACMNLKKLAMWKKKKRKLHEAISSNVFIFLKNALLNVIFVDNYTKSTCCG